MRGTGRHDEEVVADRRAGVDARTQTGVPERAPVGGGERLDRAVVGRHEDDVAGDRGAAEGGRAEPALIEKLLEVRRRLVEADLGEGIATAQWGAA